MLRKTQSQSNTRDGHVSYSVSTTIKQEMRQEMLELGLTLQYSTNIYIYVYIYVCMCVSRTSKPQSTRHIYFCTELKCNTFCYTHTLAYIFIVYVINLASIMQVLAKDENIENVFVIQISICSRALVLECGKRGFLMMYAEKLPISKRIGGEIHKMLLHV